MNKIIAKLLVVVMVMTTVVMPANFSFAETADGQQKVVTEPSSGAASDDASKGETSVDQKTESQTKQSGAGAAESKSSDAQQPGVSDSSTDAANEEAEQLVTEEMKFLYVESPQLVAPGTQNLVVSWKDSIDEITKMVLVYENSKGEQFELEEKDRTDKSILFTKDFSAAEAGTYIVKGVKYYVGETEEYFAFDDVEIDADFEVISENQASGTDENITIVENSGDSVNSSSVKKQVKQALSSADVDVSAAPKSRAAARNVVVVLDPGHGGSDVGSRYGSFYERDVNLKIAQACYDELIQYNGVTVYMTRTNNTSTNLSLAQRAAFAKSKGASVLVSMHINAGGGGSARGVEIWKPNKNYNYSVYTEGAGLSSSILSELVKLGLYNRGLKERLTANNTKYPDGSLADYYGIIRESKSRGITGIIIEHAFIDNANDRAFLSNDSNLVKLGKADALGIANYFGLTKGTWVKKDGQWKFKYSDGTYAASRWILYNGEWYYVDKNGIRVTSLQEINGQKYYFNGNGIMQTGWQRVNGYWYYFNNSGAAVKGWIYKDGAWYYLDNDNRMLTGLQTIGNKKYYLNSSGVMQTGWRNIGGDRYYFDNSGAAVKGWLYKGGLYYYFDSDYIMQTGLQNVGKYKYYLNSSGVMQKGWKKIDGSWYYFGDSGAATTGWLYQGGVYYYLNKDNTMAKGFLTLGKYKYYLNSSGVMQTGWQRVNGSWYYFSNSGAAVKGWLQLGNAWYYLDDEGKMVTGEHTINGKTYHFNSSGVWMQGYSISGTSSTTVAQMVRYYKSSGKTYPSSVYSSKKAATIEQFCQIYYEEAKAEGIRAEVAFCQAMKETGWLQFGGDVKASQCNFAGIGAIGGGAAGATFDDVRTGVRAHIQHLKAYANSVALKNPCVDPRFDKVTRGTAPYVEWLGIKENPYGKGWATAKNYGYDIVSMIKTLLKK